MLEAERTGDVAHDRPPALMNVAIKQVVLRVQSWIPEQNAGEFLAVAARHGWPTRVGGVAEGDARKLCVGPADWLVTTATMDAAALRRAIASELPQEGSVIVDLTQALAVTRLRSERARMFLASGCGLDLHPDRFGPGQCARARLANVPVVIDCRAGHEFELYVARSYGAYLQAWLADAASSA